MAKRQTVKRHETPEIQGEGSYVVVTGIKVRDIRRLRKMVRNEGLQKRNELHRAKGEPEEEPTDEFEESLKLVAKHVAEWNWVDDDGEPLLVPIGNPEVMDELTNEEAVFLIELMIGKDKAKN